MIHNKQPYIQTLEEQIDNYKDNDKKYYLKDLNTMLFAITSLEN